MESFISSMLRCCVIIAFPKLAIEDEKCANCFAACDYDAIDHAPMPLAIEWERNG